MKKIKTVEIWEMEFKDRYILKQCLIYCLHRIKKHETSGLNKILSNEDKKVFIHLLERI